MTAGPPVRPLPPAARVLAALAVGGALAGAAEPGGEPLTVDQLAALLEGGVGRADILAQLDRRRLAEDPGRAALDRLGVFADGALLAAAADAGPAGRDGLPAAEALLGDDRAGDCRAACDALLDRSPALLAARVVRAEAAAADGDAAAALDDLTAALDARPHWDAVRLRRAALRVDRAAAGDAAAARQDLERLDSPAAAGLRVKLARAAGRPADALADARSAVAAFPNDPAAYELLADLRATAPALRDPAAVAALTAAAADWAGPAATRPERIEEETAQTPAAPENAAVVDDLLGGLVPLDGPGGAFRLARGPVTVGQWRRVTGEAPPGQGEEEEGAAVDGPRFADVLRFLSALNGLPGGGAFRLPTASEWEWAATTGGDPGPFGSPPPLAEWVLPDADARRDPRPHPLRWRKPAVNRGGPADGGGGEWFERSRRSAANGAPQRGVSLRLAADAATDRPTNERTAATGDLDAIIGLLEADRDRRPTAAARLAAVLLTRAARSEADGRTDEAAADRARAAEVAPPGTEVADAAGSAEPPGLWRLAGPGGGR